MADMTTEQMRATIAAAERERIQAAGDAVTAALREHGCDLVAAPQVTPDGRIVAVVQIVAR